MKRFGNCFGALLVGIAMLLVPALGAPIQPVHKGPVMLLVQDQKSSPSTPSTPTTSNKKPKKPPVKKPKPHPAGAADATKGQKGQCICSTNAAGNTTCTGDCSK